MKILNWIGWASAAVGAILIALGTISQLFKSIHLGVQHNFSIFIAAISFLLLAITIFVASNKCCCGQDCCEKPKE
jgi:hypothetical protein